MQNELASENNATAIKDWFSMLKKRKTWENAFEKPVKDFNLDAVCSNQHDRWHHNEIT